MSPLLSARPSITVTLRLAAACAVMLAAAGVVALAAGDEGRPTAAVPACLAGGVVCAALVAHMLHASQKALDDPRLGWMSAGVTLAFAGLLTSLLAQGDLFPRRVLVAPAGDADAARFLVWHAALVLAGILAFSGSDTTRRGVGAFVGAGLVLLLWTAIASAPFGHLVGDEGFTPFVRIGLGALVILQLAIAFAWWRDADGAPTWTGTCVIAGMVLSAGDALAYSFATEPFQDAWWASLALRAGQFAVPAVGLLVGFIAVAEKLRDFENELARTLIAERERAAAEQERATLDHRRRERIRERIGRMIGGHGLEVAFQPIVDLASGQVVGAEALARFTADDGTQIPTERCFLDAHAVDLGVELELAVIRLALGSERRLPQGRYLALNVSPALLEGDELLGLIAGRRSDRPVVLELTEHQPVEDYVALGAALARLREHGIRVAVDDVGSGFASFRHVTRVNPDILKLDRTLVCGIDDDPVRQSLASAIVTFARDVGAVVVSEGIESESELNCLKDLAVGCGQGFYLARPNTGAIDAHVPQLMSTV